MHLQESVQLCLWKKFSASLGYLEKSLATTVPNLSAVMQQLCFLLKIHQSFISVYHPQANPVERKNGDLKQSLAILVEDQDDFWCEKLTFIRFAINTAKCS
ncbi:hypothetical protein AVEN_44510-1 [Araneus ventricosus]|uniref:Integrase catalytic domain-containing protein n=1 Tax=Araneus ventricosus TaxID=182803 RepID=A0A4Y2NRL6_ARAVE|nr:hypothetical protein AVEN_44510-1 [Araneus ventricosus]